MLTSATLANESKVDEDMATARSVRDENLLALGDGLGCGKGHDLAPGVPTVLRVAHRLAGVVKVGCDGKDTFAPAEAKASSDSLLVSRWRPRVLRV